ncbi:ATP-binding protein [Pelotomaculum propionicicum]|uniref:sensor histidine kinase n=1 Tax=Pelotomaculum propionicicum TaxID=258475 RepID=UPI003B7988F5
MKLGAKISVSMVALALVATLIAAYVAGIAIRRSFDFYVDRNLTYRLDRIGVVLAGYYLEEGGWTGVQAVFDSLQLKGGGYGYYGGQGVPRAGAGRRAMGAETMMGPGSWDVLLLDASDIVVASSDETLLGRPAPESSIGQSALIEVNGVAVGKLIVVNLQKGIWENEFVSSLNNAILWAAVIAAIIALILGMLVSKHLTGPLAMLTTAASRLGGRDLGYRAPVVTGDEIGELAKSFNFMADNFEKNERLRRNLIADAAHELRTPLSILRGNLESLQEGIIKPSPEIIISLHDEVVRISRLVNELQEISLADAGELRLNRRSVSADELVEKATLLFSSEAMQKNVNFLVDVQAGMPQVNADPDRIAQVILNILKNALFYTEPGGTVKLSAAAKDGGAVFSVQDTGIGIAPGDLANVFDRFYRSEQSRHRAGGGAGLGLAIAKGIVEAHGGEIWAESKVNEGSTFYFSVPVYKQNS